MGIFSQTNAKGEKRVPIWSSQMKGERGAVLKMVLMAFGIITFFLWGFQSWYFGVYFSYRLTVRVLDLDSAYANSVAGAPAAILGPAIRQAIQTNIQSKPHSHLGWQIADDAEISQLKLTTDGQGMNATDYAQHLVLDQTVFGAIVIHANATVLATEAAQTGSTGYDPRGSMSFFYEEARNFYATNQYLVVQTNQIINTASNNANVQLAQNLLQTASNAGSTTGLLTALNGKALTNPFGFSTWNLRPFDQIVAEAPTTAGAIYLIILTFLISPPWKAAFTPFANQINLASEMLLKVAVPLAMYFWLSLMYSLVSLAFLLDFSRKYGKIGFFLYWMMQWTTMSGLGLVMECALALLGPLGMPFFLVAWVIFNVSAAFIDLADLDHFYSYGFITPVWNSVDASKSILLATKNHLAQNFLVNLSWVIVAAIALAAIVAFQRKKADKQEAKQRSEKSN